MTVNQLPPSLLDILVCPQCKGVLHAPADGSSLDCRRCALRFPVRDGIPIMLLDEAQPL